MDSALALLGQFIGKEAGRRLSGGAPFTVSAARARALGNHVPRGATPNRCLDELTFATRSVSFAVEAAPPNNPDMTFRVGGLVDPTIVVPDGARVRVEFINADEDEAHGFLITPAKPPFSFAPPRSPAFTGSSAAVLGDPTPSGQGAEVFAFVASAPGRYSYVCPMPGHAQMGMHGEFVVR